MRAAAFALGLAVVCPGTGAADTPAGTSMAGFARYESNKWLFRPCIGQGRNSTLRQNGVPFIDATPGGILFTAVQERWRQSTDPSRGVFVEVSGYVEDGRMTITRLQRALGWVESCSTRPANVPPGARAWAAGNEPSWSFGLEGNVATVRTMDAAQKIADGAWKATGSTAVYQSTDGGQLRIEFTDGLCNDTMAEASFGWRVVAAVDGRLLTGCGLVR